MSNIMNRIGDRYDAFTDYFKDNSLGSDPSVLTVLSLLPPVDRCIILERVFQFGKCDFMVCIDKLSMAYVKAGWREIAYNFLEKLDAAGWLYGNAQFFYDKLSGLTVSNVSRSYRDVLAKLPSYDTGSGFCRILRAFCLEYAGDELIDGTESESDIADFLQARRTFVAEMTNRRDSALVIPSRESGAGMGYTLANSQCLAFCYLLGGARISNFRFATSDGIVRMDEVERGIWSQTEEIVRRFAPYPYAVRRDGGERAYLASVEFPCYSDWSYQYRTSGQRVSIDDVIDLMYEVIDVKPRAFRFTKENGEKYIRFSWMFLEDDVERLLAIFPSVEYDYGNWAQSRAVFRDMDRILNSIARRALNMYPFMECEFTGW